MFPANMSAWAVKKTTGRYPDDHLFSWVKMSPMLNGGYTRYCHYENFDLGGTRLMSGVTFYTKDVVSV